MAKNILSLSSQDAVEFFLKSEQHHGFVIVVHYDPDDNYIKIGPLDGTTP